MKEYDLYVPLAYNDGRPIEGRKLVRLRERLLAEFGGLAFFPQPNQGFWTFGGITYHDNIVTPFAPLIHLPVMNSSVSCLGSLLFHLSRRRSPCP